MSSAKEKLYELARREGLHGPGREEPEAPARKKVAHRWRQRELPPQEMREGLDQGSLSLEGNRMRIISSAGAWLRPLPCPFPVEVNPHAEAVNRESFIWLAKSRMLERRSLEKLRRAETGWLVARTNPRARRGMLRVLTD